MLDKKITTKEEVTKTYSSKYLLGLGEAPKNLGTLKVNLDSFCYFLYLPIFLSYNQHGSDWRWYRNLPKQLQQPSLRSLISTCIDDIYYIKREPVDYNIYLTIKKMYVTKSSPGNREGWHMDGFKSNGDINYIWSDLNPTEFAVQHFNKISNDDLKSIIDVTSQVDPTKIKTYPNNTLLRLNEEVVHRVGHVQEEGVRTFVKVTFSKHKFTNEGNSINYNLSYNWKPTKRSLNRNLDHGNKT